MADQLSLAGVTFDDFSTPNGIGAGGKQAMVIHKLPGGARVIDTLGPDEHPIGWSGQFFGEDTLTNVQTLDAIRAAGQVVPLIFAGQFRYVILEDFKYTFRRYPLWAEYSINCTVYRNPGVGAVEAVAFSLSNLVTADISFAVGLLR